MANNNHGKRPVEEEPDFCPVQRWLFEMGYDYELCFLDYHLG
jgi:hypothetical protein